MIGKLLVANRGEIAARVIRTAREMGIATVAVASEADRDSLAATAADEMQVIGPAPAGVSYLDQAAVLRAAKETGCDAVHPGYGFLSENPAFARAVINAGLTWVGPSPEAIELMGNKANAIALARRAGVPVLAELDGPLTDEKAVAAANRIGYPLMVKASAGGGGRGIRYVRNPEFLLSTIEMARVEARATFGDDAIYLERFVMGARHVEVQVLSDGKHAIHLGDRDCSMQRRSQKVLEEAPAPDLPSDVRADIREAAVRLALECGYVGVGTVEFLYDTGSKSAAFIEMNTRLQVEHPITEAITNIDLVREQLAIAGGEPLTLTQDDIVFTGHGIECRINAEDPGRDFFPSPGKIAALDWPPDGKVNEPFGDVALPDEGPCPSRIRVDTGYETGSVVTPFYDSLIAKLIVHAPTRDEAIIAMRDALSATRVEGIATTIPLHQYLLSTTAFAQVSHHTKYIEDFAFLEAT